MTLGNPYQLPQFPTVSPPIGCLISFLFLFSFMFRASLRFRLLGWPDRVSPLLPPCQRGRQGKTYFFPILLNIIQTNPIISPPWNMPNEYACKLVWFILPPFWLLRSTPCLPELPTGPRERRKWIVRRIGQLNYKRRRSDLSFFDLLVLVNLHAVGVCYAFPSPADCFRYLTIAAFANTTLKVREPIFTNLTQPYPVRLAFA